MLIASSVRSVGVTVNTNTYGGVRKEEERNTPCLLFFSTFKFEELQKHRVLLL